MEMKNSIVIFIVAVGLGMGLNSCTEIKGTEAKDTRKDSYNPGIQHGIIYSEKGRFAAWPANNGVWHWDNDEILVGFKEGAYSQSTSGLHKIDWSSECGKYARSLDGGSTWTIEDAYDQGQTTMGSSDQVKGQISQLEQPMDNFNGPNFILTFKRENNNNGSSHFYYSLDRGKKWAGPYAFPNLGLPGIVSRTDYLVDSPKTLSAFLTASKSNEKEGRVVYVQTNDGGNSWELVSMVGQEHEGFDIMPSSLRLSTTELITTIRTRTGDNHDKIIAYYSVDNGKSWEKLRDPVSDTGRGGSPPALVKLKDGRLALGYAYRSEHGSRMNVRFSEDKGKSWSDEIVIRGGDGANRDVGYPVMVQRNDGKLVLIYYWNNALADSENPYRYIAYSIFDPSKWN